MKVLHLPTSVGGNAWGLAQGERELGLDSKVLVDSENWLKYPYDYCMCLEKYGKLGKFLKRTETFFKVRKTYNIYHFNFGSTLVDAPSYGINMWDLPFYTGKKVMTFNGCDARMKYPTMKRVKFSACHEEDCYAGICNSGKKDIERARRIMKIEKYVDHIFYLNPDLQYSLPGNATFLPYTIAGWKDIKSKPCQIKKKIKIVHSPTNRAAKGSVYILKALEEIKKKYDCIDIDIVENLPYEQALKKYQEADIVIDQVLIGWYGAFGVEIMKMGKPLAVFIREEDLGCVPKQMAEDLKEAVININPFNIVEVLEEYLENQHLLFQKSEAALEYVHRWHNPTYVAKLTKSIYESL